MAKQFHAIGLVINLGAGLCGLFLLQATDGRRVTCVAAKTSQDRNGTFCKCYEVPRPPWSVKPVKPAPYPDRATVRFSTRNVAYPHIQWTQRESYLHGTGYYLEILHMTDTLRYKCDINSSQVKTSVHAPEITFHFKDCCESILELFKPGKLLSVTIDAIPMYNVDDDAKTIGCITTVPFPKTTRPPRSARRTRLLKRKNRQKSTTAVAANNPSKNEEEISTSENTPLIVLISLVAILVCLVVFAAIVLRKRRENQRKKYKEVEVRKILVISDTDQRYISFVSEFVEIFKKYGKAETEIITNVRKTSEIADDGIIKWTLKNISDANIVVFVVAKPERIRSNSEYEDQSLCLHVALDITEVLVLKKGFGAARKKFLAFDLTNSFDSADLPFCTRYTIKNDVKKMIKHALGVHYNCKTDAWKHDIEILQKLLPATENTPNTGARNTASQSFEDVGVNDLEARKNNNLVQTFELNNLNYSIMSRRGASVTPSVQNEQYPSIENNEDC